MDDFEAYFSSSWDFATEDPHTQDLLRLAEMVDYYTPVYNDAEKATYAASGLIAQAYGMGEGAAHADAEFLRNQRTEGRLYPNILALSDSDFETWVSATVAEWSAEYAFTAKPRLQQLIAQLKRRSGVEQAHQLIGVLGISQTVGGDLISGSIADKERAAQLVRTSKLMDSAYRDFVILNFDHPHLDPGIVAELDDGQDPHKRRIIRLAKILQARDNTATDI